MFPEKIFYEPDVENYTQGRELLAKYSNRPSVKIESHNNIPELRQKPNSAFSELKNYLILGVRKTHKYSENYKVSDYLVPYTSSGCSASCLYCYLVCNYNKCSYLRIFVNREQMLDKLIKFSKKAEKDLCFEIGSNSDLILENTITKNLEYTIPEFARRGKGFLTFPSKFSAVTPLLDLDHKGKTIFRMSVNPEYVINTIEKGTASLKNRISALNQMCDAGYPVGLLIAPVVLYENWENDYANLISRLADDLSEKVRNTGFIEIILMTYSYIHNAINTEAFPDAPSLYNKQTMTGRGRGKYCYKNNIRDECEQFIRNEVENNLPNMRIWYIS